jgi:hypothetical protein
MNTLRVAPLLALFSLVGCTALPAPEPLPLRPVISCKDCGELTYWGPQQAPPPNPNVEIAKVVKDGLLGISGFVAAGNVLNSFLSNASNGLSQSSTTVRETSTTVDRDHSDTRVTEVNNTTSTSDVSNTRTEINHQQEVVPVPTPNR